jgi:hypothetical protein
MQFCILLVMTTSESRIAVRPETAEAFTAHMVEVLNAAGVALLVSIGHQTGLFDTHAGLPAATIRRNRHECSPMFIARFGPAER